MLTTNEIVEQVEDASKYFGKFGQPERTAYNERVAALESEWFDYLVEEYASGYTAGQARVIFSRAWEDGHSAGYYEIESHFISLVEFQEEFQRA